MKKQAPPYREAFKKKYGIIWEFFPTWGWEGLPNSQNSKRKKIALKSPQNHPNNKLNFSQNHPKNFILNEAFPKGGGGGGGADVWEKFPNNPVFFF